MDRERLWSPQFISMGASNFLLLMSQYLLVAGLPIYIMDTLGGNEMEAGLAMSFFQIGAVSCRPFAGRIIDSLDKKKLMFVATLAFFVVMALFNFLRTQQDIYMLRLLHGVIFALATTGAATMATLILPNSRKGEGIGYFSLTTNLALVVGPLIGLVLVAISADALFLFLTALGLIILLVVNFSHMPESVTKPTAKKSGFSFTSFVERKAVPPSFLGGLVFFAYGGILTFMPIYAKSLGMQQQASLFFMVFALLIVVTRPFIGRLFDRKGPDYTVYPGFMCFIIGLVLFSQIHTLVGLLGAAAILGVGFGALSPAFQTLAVESAPPARAGSATATYYWSLDISVGLATVFLGMAATQYGYSAMYGIASSAVLFVACVLYFVWRRGHKNIRDRRG